MLRGLLTRLLMLLPTPMLERGLRGFVALKVRTLPPDDALRFLFRVDGFLYGLQGQLAVRYGNGVHVKHRFTGYHEFFVERVRPGERVLDVGCGVGAVAVDIAERAGAWVVGIDQNEENIRLARERFAHPRVRYVSGDALKCFSQERFDVVVLSNVLEHLRGRAAFLREVRRVLGPSRILIRVPLFERDWRVPLRRELGLEWRLDATHETEYTPESFAREVAEAGMSIIHQEIRWGEIWAEAR